jgi:hypothetical protein
MEEIQFDYKGKTHAVAVDDDALETLNKHQWYGFESPGGYLYCARFSGDFSNPVWFLHWDIMGKPAKGYHVDHRDGNTLNCQRVNMRICTHRENLTNRKRHKNNTSGYKGVTRNKGKWGAQIKSNYKLIWLGTFDDPVSAALAYDRAAREIFGEFANLNFPDASKS